MAIHRLRYKISKNLYLYAGDSRDIHTQHFSSAMYAADYAYGYQHISKPIPIPTSDKEPR